MRKKKGKDFEELISWIHQCVHDRAEVTPNAKLRDRGTGKLRQIDILIAVADGPVELAAIVECRDHKRKVGVPYLEHVAKKVESVGVNKAFVVSKSGFCKTALVKAEDLGIGLFTYEEARSGDWSNWFLPRSMPYTIRMWKPLRVFMFASDGRPIQPHEDVLQAVEKSGRAKIVTDEHGKAVGSLADLAQSYRAAVEELLHQGVEPGAPPIRRVLPAIPISAEQDIGVVGQEGKRERIGAVAVEADIWVEQNEAEFRKMEYRDGSDAHAEVFTAELRVGDAVQRIEIMGVHHDGDPAGTRRPSIRISRPPTP